MAYFPSREDIAVALWSLLQSDPGVKGQFITAGRVLLSIDNMAFSQMPAVFQIQHGEQRVKPGKGMSPKRTMQLSWVMYAAAKQGQEPPSTLLNNMMNVIDNLIENPGNPGNVQTLGGLVEHVYLEGDVHVVEGQLSSGENASVLVAPITILIP